MSSLAKSMNANTSYNLSEYTQRLCKIPGPIGPIRKHLYSILNIYCVRGIEE